MTKAHGFLAGHGDGDMEKMIFNERALADVGLCLEFLCHLRIS